MIQKRNNWRLHVDNLYYKLINTSMGNFLAAWTKRGICKILLPGMELDKLYIWAEINLGMYKAILTDEFNDVVTDLNQYFCGKSMIFNYPLDLYGTPFEKMVWQRTSEIPYGSTVTYGQIADDIGRPKACRAVGSACGKNPVPIIIPCHRIIGQNNSLTGYAGGLKLKKMLLGLENGYKYNKTGQSLNCEINP